MVKIVLDQETSILRISMTADEEWRMKIDADKLGLSVQEMLQAQLERSYQRMMDSRHVVRFDDPSSRSSLRAQLLGSAAVIVTNNEAGPGSIVSGVEAQDVLRAA